MWLIRMAWKNIWRNKGRSLITMSAIFFAVLLILLDIVGLFQHDMSAH